MSARDYESFLHIGSLSNVPESYPFMVQQFYQSAAAFTLQSQRYLAAPVMIGENTPTFVQFGYWTSVTASIVMRIGIYAKTSANNLWPGKLLLDCGTLSVQSAGPWANSISFVASANDLLWAVHVTSFGLGSPQLVGGTEHAVFGLDATLQAPFAGVSAPGSMVLPSTFPTSGVLGDGSGLDVCRPILRC